MKKNIQGHLFALSANILWGLMVPIGKSALTEFSPLSVTTNLQNCRHPHIPTLYQACFKNLLP